MKFGRWQSKEEAARHFRAILHRSPSGHPICGEDEADLRWLFSRHPEVNQKEGAGVAWFYVGPSTYGTSCFHVRRTDGTTTDWSYLAALRGLAPSMAQQFRQAAREAVRPGLQRVKERHFSDSDGVVARCSETGAPMKWSQAVVDHRPPWLFMIICDSFLATRNLVPSYDWISAPADNQSTPIITDPSILADFIRFHDERADLVVVCADVNQRHGAKMVRQ